MSASDPLRDALTLQRDAAELGFDWRHLHELWAKLAEEIEELKQAVPQGGDAVEAELGDLLFMVVNLARHLGVDPAAALARTNAKFTHRFAYVAARLELLPPIGDARRLDAMEALWLEAKRLEKNG
ncbi:MazG nucleotide pyrophosphohydrolase domain-containing protein [Fontimonas thermophila]|uniref:MazG nucleotide pyrophosphohydrolase domain-containing protein n=1 Tax=Fontimonas thermophila TaxID=1076937 RepID=A0A1I2HZK3_9GAMM|nr:MazG nucleotide pyrophosphohydrolase domain-containing protein [Fontimonas thermophila]SFF33801.1 MazG nucleotide pyrophosphohydrolase domain-containing protein [Fontimonas thermophila]